MFTRTGKNPGYKYFARPDDYSINTATLSQIIQVSVNDEGRSFIPFFIIDNLINNYDEVHWSALYGNTAIKSCDHYLKKKEREGYIISRDPPFDKDISEIKEYDQFFYFIGKSLNFLTK